MPVYEFTCPECGQEAEVIRSVADYDKPLYCDGTQLEPEPAEHAITKMERRVSRLGATFTRGPRYA